MIPNINRYLIANYAFPRMSGDDPRCTLEHNRTGTFSPHERG